MEIEVRRVEPSDAKALQEIFECENAYTQTLQLPNPTLKLWTERLLNTPPNIYSYVAILDGEIVGNLGLELCTNERRRHVASFGMGVKDHVTGRGVGSALLAKATDFADNWLNVKRLEMTVYTDNECAINLYKKFGFEIEGESPAYAYRNGEYVAAYHMARLR